MRDEATRQDAARSPASSSGWCSGKGADPEHVREVLEVQAACSAETMAAFLPTFSTTTASQALAALAEVPPSCSSATSDLLCPLPHSRAIAAALPRAELVVYPGVGHMVQLERRPEVSRRLVALLDRVVPARERVAV